jgi:catechol 2,3-dioxygenase-like lactoylglutathione lyase family enzyme
MRVTRLDHLVLTVYDIQRTATFYGEVLGMEHVLFGEGRHALAFGEQKINLHEHGHEFEPKAARPTPGSADLCFVAGVPLEDTLTRLAGTDTPIEHGPVTRTGALGPMTSVYIRDPDHNLIEIAHYPPS